MSKNTRKPLKEAYAYADQFAPMSDRAIPLDELLAYTRHLPQREKDQIHTHLIEVTLHLCALSARKNHPAYPDQFTPMAQGITILPPLHLSQARKTDLPQLADKINSHIRLIQVISKRETGGMKK